MNKFINLSLDTLLKKDSFNIDSFSENFFKKFKTIADTDKEKTLKEALDEVTRHGNEVRLQFIHLFKKRFKSFAEMMTDVEAKTDNDIEKRNPTDIDMLVYLLKDKFPGYFINEISKIVYYKKKRCECYPPYGNA